MKQAGSPFAYGKGMQRWRETESKGCKEEFKGLRYGMYMYQFLTMNLFFVNQAY